MTGDAGFVRRASEEIGSLVDGAALDPTQWGAVIDELCHLLPGTKGVLQMVDQASGHGLPLLLSGWDDAVSDAYHQHYGAINPWAPVMINAPLQTLLFSEERLPASAFQNTEFYADWLSRAGGADGSTGVKLIDAEGRLGVVALHYDARHATRINADAGPILMRLAPRMRRALDINRACFAPKRQSLANNSLFNALADPALLISEDFRLRDANAEGLKLLEAGDVLRIGASDRLHFKDASFERTFRAHVSDALTPPGSRQLIRPSDRSATSHDSRYIIFAAAFQNEALRLMDLSLLFSSKRQILVLLKRKSFVADDASRTLHNFGLTPAEIRLALRLDGSKPLASVAAEIGVSYETARTQRRSIYTKLGVSRQGQFVATRLQILSGR